MSYPEYPLDLPQDAEAAGFERRPYRAQPETEMEGGDVRLRHRPGDRLETVSWARRFTPAELDLWRQFLAADLADGTRRFVMPVWAGTGAGYEPRLVQIVGGGGGVSETPTGRGLYTRVSFSLLVFPPEMLPPEIWS